MLSLELFVIIATGLTGVASLFVTAHWSQREGHRLTRVGCVATIFVMVGTAAAAALSLRKQHDLSEEQERSRRFEIQVTTLQSELTKAIEYGRRVETINGQLSVECEKLQMQVEMFKTTLQDAQQTAILNVPQKISANVNDSRWEHGSITLRLQLPFAARLKLVSFPVTEDFPAGPLFDSARTLRVELVNVNSRDINAPTLAGTAEFDWWHGYTNQSRHCAHGDKISVKQSAYSGKFAVMLDPSNLATLTDVLKRNPDAGVRLTVVEN